MTPIPAEKSPERGDTAAAPNREAEKRLTKLGPRPVTPLPRPIEIDVVTDNYEGAFISETLQPVHGGSLPTETTTAPSAPSAVRGHTGRNISVAVLAVGVIALSGFAATWLKQAGGLSALMRSTGDVTVSSEPTGATVSINDAVRGVTPLTIALEPGAYSVVVGTGANARSQSVSVTRGGVASMHVQLPAAAATTGAAPATAGTGGLQIATEPAGARVWVDGEARGTAPLTVQSLSPGNHAVTVRGRTGEPINRTVSVPDGTTASLVITMPASDAPFASGWLAISTPMPLQIMEEGVLIGTTDTPRIMLGAGAHDLELVNATLGYRLPRRFTIVAGQTASFTVVPPRGTLSINALPWAEVSIDGQRIGETPIGNYSIPIGVHEVVFRHPELGEQRKSVTVSAQAPSRVGVDMKKP